MGIRKCEIRKCICQICICGRHRCCGHRKEKVPFAQDKEAFQAITEHKYRFKPFGCLPRQQPIIPSADAKWKGDEPLVKLSTTKEDYVPKPISKRTAKRPKAYKEPKVQFADCTTYRHDFIPKKWQPRSLIKSEDSSDALKMPGKMEGASTYRTSYTPKPCLQREPAEVKKGTLTILGQPFKGESETRDRFQAPPLIKREKISPMKGELKPDGDFMGETTHKTDYPPKYVIPPKPLKKLPKWKASTDKFQDCTTHRHDYRCHPMFKKLSPIVPAEAKKFDGPFEGVSHYKKDFQPHEVLPRQLPDWHPSFRQQKKSDAPMSRETTYKTDYEAPPDDVPAQPAKPLKDNLGLPCGPMEKMTTSRRDYKPHHPVKTESFKPDLGYKKPEGRFSDCTTTRHDYTAKAAEKIQISKMGDNLHCGDGDMEDTSISRRDYQWTCVDCPAGYLKRFGKDALVPKYTFDKVESGHQFFCKEPKISRKSC